MFADVDKILNDLAIQYSNLTTVQYEKVTETIVKGETVRTYDLPVDVDIMVIPRKKESKTINLNEYESEGILFYTKNNYELMDIFTINGKKYIVESKTDFTKLVNVIKYECKLVREP